VHERPEVDPARVLRSRREELERVSGDRELREEEVLDDGVGVEAHAVGVHDLLDGLPVLDGRGLRRPALHLRIEAELHPVDSSSRRSCAATLTQM
jgi:hypothetical protein